MSEGAVIGAGIDLVEVDRMRDVLRRWGSAFAERVFLPEERAYCEGQHDAAAHYAGRFAVKEAVSKAFGTGIGGRLGMLDIEVVRNPTSGAPTVRLSDRAQDLAHRMGAGRVIVSLSHTRHQAIAQALLLGGADGSMRGDA